MFFSCTLEKPSICSKESADLTFISKKDEFALRGRDVGVGVAHLRIKQCGNQPVNLYAIEQTRLRGHLRVGGAETPLERADAVQHRARSLISTQVSNINSAFNFYRASVDPDYSPGNKLISGLRDSAVSWAIILPLYWYCEKGAVVA